MNSVTKRFAWVGVGALSALVITVSASADDTELFIGAANGVNTAQPNILFIIDDSGSMGDLVSSQPNYDPRQTYGGSCGSGHVYYSTTGNAPDCSSTNWFNKSALVCKAAQPPTGESSSASAMASTICLIAVIIWAPGSTLVISLQQ